MKKVLSLVLVLCMVLSCVPILAEDADVYANFIIEEREDTVIIKGLKTDVKEIVIPGEINGKQVEIGDSAFQNKSLKKVVLDERIKEIPRSAFNGCKYLEEINLENIEVIGDCAFMGCQSLKEVNLLNIKSWSGIGENSINDEGTLMYFPYNEKLFTHDVSGIFTVFYGAKIDKLRIKWPEVNFAQSETFPALFVNATINEVVFENFTIIPSVAEFKSTGMIAANPRWQEKVDLIQKNTDMVIYSEDERVEEYAEKIGVKFVFTGVKKIEVEPAVQSIHGGIVLRYKFADRITKIAESMGGMVTVSGNDIAIQKNGKSLAIVGDIVYYMDNGVMVTENLYEDMSFIKMPEKALESILGTDSRKSEEYKETINLYNGKIYRLVGTIETPYGTIAEICTGGVMHGFANVLILIKWDGTTVNITKDAPYYNLWSEARWKKIELSEDGKILTITYPENKERWAFSQSPASPERVLWDEGTYIITANLETGEVKCVIKPLAKEKVEEKEEVKEPAVERVEPAKAIVKDGMKVSVSILSEPQNGPMNMFDENYISYCVLYVEDETKPEYMEFDLGSVKNVEKLALAFRDATTRTTYFDVRVSEDGVNFETVIEKRGSNGDTNELQYFDINKNARYVRVYGYSNTFNKKWVSITEARVIAK